MALIDTTDNVLMTGVYAWAFREPIRKFYYNLTITLVSVLVALLVGGIEALGLIAQHRSGQGAFWSALDFLNNNFAVIGFAIIGVFAASWIASILIGRWKCSDTSLSANWKGQQTPDLMKHKNIPKSLTELSPEIVEMETANPEQACPKPRPSSEQQPQQNRSPIPVPEYYGVAGYPHWGLNE